MSQNASICVELAAISPASIAITKLWSTERQSASCSWLRPVASLSLLKRCPNVALSTIFPSLSKNRQNAPLEAIIQHTFVSSGIEEGSALIHADIELQENRPSMMKLVTHQQAIAHLP